MLQWYGKPIRNRSDAEAFLAWLRAEGLTDCTISGLMTHYRQCSGGNRHLFSHKLKWQRRSVQSDVLSVEAAMLVEVQKWNKAFKDLQQLLIQQIRQEYQKTSGGLGG